MAKRIMAFALAAVMMLAILPVMAAAATPDYTTSTYTVVKGDTLGKIATKFGTTWQAIYELNKGTVYEHYDAYGRLYWKITFNNPNYILPGWELDLPTRSAPTAPAAPGDNIYVVQRGDFLLRIAIRYNTTVAELVRLNPAIKNPNLIYPGQWITLW